MLRRLTINDTTLQNSPNQYAIYRACIVDSIPRVVVSAGRKFGKTYVSVRIARDWAAKNPGEIILIAAPEYSYLRDQVVPELRKAIPDEAVGGGWGKGYNKSEHILTMANDAQIFLRTMDNPDSVRPLSIAGLIAEEFSLWGRYAWDECVRPTLMAKGAPALFIFTPKGMNQAHELWTRAIDGEENYKAFHYTSYDGPVPKENIDAEAATMPEGVRRQEIMGEFLADLGGVFQGVAECIAGDKEPESVPGENYVIGADVGAVNDFCVGTVVKRSTRAVVWQERFTGVEPESVAERFKELSSRYNDAVAWIDETGLGWGVADRLRVLGAPTKPYKFTAESKRQVVTNLVMAISGRSIRYPDIPELINELNIYQSKQTPRGNVQYSAPSGYHDDCVIALGLAVWGLGSGGDCSPPSCSGERTFKGHDDNA